VTIGEGCFIGMRPSIVPKVRVGDGAVATGVCSLSVEGGREGKPSEGR
jgi:carbonic anhydrase/acetyltransferase-like protein (isoleucine patch superfamily)